MRTDTTTEYSTTFYALLKSFILRQKTGSYDVWFSFYFIFFKFRKFAFCAKTYHKRVTQL